MFNVGDKIFYPMHGAGIIEDVVLKNILGETKKYFVVKLSCTTMNISIPFDKINSVSMRRIITKNEAATLIDTLRNHVSPVNENWNSRYRENLEKIMTSDIFEIGKVVKELTLREKIKPLSTGERKMLTSSKNIFISELTLVFEKTYEQVEEMLEEIL